MGTVESGRVLRGNTRKWAENAQIACIFYGYNYIIWKLVRRDGKVSVKMGIYGGFWSVESSALYKTKQMI